MYNFIIFLYQNIYFFKNNSILNLFFLSVKNPNILFLNFTFIYFLFFKNTKVYICVFIFIYSYVNFFTKKYFLQFIKLTNRMSVIHPIIITFFLNFLNLIIFKKINLYKYYTYVIIAILLGSLWSDQELFWGGL